MAHCIHTYLNSIVVPVFSCYGGSNSVLGSVVSRLINNGVGSWHLYLHVSQSHPILDEI